MNKKYHYLKRCVICIILMLICTIISNPITAFQKDTSKNESTTQSILTSEMKSEPYYFNKNLMEQGSYWYYDDGIDAWCTDFPAITLNEAIVWRTEITDAYEAYLTFTHEYDLIDYYFYNATTDKTYEYEAKGYVEISADDGENWYILNIVTGDSGGSIEENYDISYWAGNEILIQFRVQGYGSNYFSSYPGGSWCIWDMYITGAKDNNPPVSTISVTGLLENQYWTPNIVHFTINSYDNELGVKEIHYILDGHEMITAGNTIEVVVDSNGPHNLESYWAVDYAGNEEAPKTGFSFGLDYNDPPTVRITAPEPGVYIFGNKVLSSTKIFIIGSFPIEADVNDDYSGIKVVKFYLNDILIGEDTEESYKITCAIKNSGEATIKIIAEDFATNTGIDTLDIIYYKFI